MNIARIWPTRKITRVGVQSHTNGDSPVKKTICSTILLGLLLTFAVASCMGERNGQADNIISSTKNLEPTFIPETKSVIGDSPPPIVSPYFVVLVESVEIRRFEDDSTQIELVIRLILPDQCDYDFHSVENRNKQSVRISLKAIHPNDTSCAQTSQSLEYLLPLGKDLPESDRGFSQGEYQLTVNNFQTTFIVGE